MYLEMKKIAISGSEDDAKNKRKSVNGEGGLL